MRELDGQHREGVKRRGNQPDPAVKELFRSQEDQQDRECVHRRRHRPPEQRVQVITRLPGPLPRVAQHEERQGAVNKKTKIFVGWVERRSCGIKIFTRRPNRLNHVNDHRKIAFIRMQMPGFVPVIVQTAEAPSSSKNRQQNENHKDGFPVNASFLNLLFVFYVHVITDLQ